MLVGYCREIEIRKARGAPITVVRLPFSIIENQGMKVYTPPSLSEVPQPDKDPIFKSVCRGCEWLSHIRAGQFMYITYPLELFPGDYLLITIANAILSGGKLLIVSYEYPPEYIWFMVAETIRAQQGIELPTDEIGESLKNYVSIEAYNPALYSSNDLYLLTLEAIARIRPRIVAILGNPEVVWGESSIEMYSDLIFNLILHFRKLRLVTILISGYLEKSYSIFSRIADLIIRAKTTTSSNESTMLYQIVRKGGRPTIVEDESFAQCVKEAAEMLVKMIHRQL
ncbi:MAG: hypothetical protein RMI45_00860 [Ignisphaera sp.]|nr:hypothetical protein [Ignisphaera sp.]MDW8084776.1 hypothetical protein [Ignisphaera sp.]